MDDKKLIKKLESVIIKTLKKEGGASGLKPLKKAIEKLDKPKKFNLVNFLSKMKNVKKHTNSDYILTPINENSLTKLDIKNLIKESIKELKEQAYGSATVATQGQAKSRAVAPRNNDEFPLNQHYVDYKLTKSRLPGVMEQEEVDLISTAEEMYGIAAIEQFGRIHLYPDNKPEDKRYISYRTNKTYIIVKDDLKTIEYISGHGGPELTDLANSLGLNKIGSGQFAGIDTYEGPHTVNSPEDMKDIINKMEAATSGEAQRQSAFYTREPGTGGTGIDETSIRINDIKEQEQQGGEEQPKTPEVEEEEPAHSPEEIGECKAKCLNMDIENLEVQKKNVQAKLLDIQRKGVDLKPSELKQQRDAKKQLNTSLKSIKKEIKKIKEQQEQLMNPGEKQSTNESINKKNMRTNAKKLWNNYSKDRLSKTKSLKEHMNDHKKLARRRVLQEGVMNTFFEYFDQGNTNEEIVQLYAGKGVNVPEQFVSKARKQHEQYSKMKFELEMSEKAFKNEASQIVNNPGSMGETMVTDEDKQLASGLFNEQEETPVKPEKEHKDVDMLLKRISTINVPAEFESVFKKLMTHSTEISGLSTSKIIGLLKQAIKEI